MQAWTFCAGPQVVKQIERRERKMLDVAYYETPLTAHRQAGLLCLAYGHVVHKRISTPPRRLTCYAAVWISRGSGWLETAATSGRLPVEAGTFFWLFPGITHSYAPDAQGWTEQWIMFEGAQADWFVQHDFFTPEHPLHQVAQPEAVEELFTQISQDFAQGGHLVCLRSATWVSRLILTVHQATLEEHMGKSPVANELQRYKRALEEYAFAPCSLEEIAYQSQWSSATLRRYFKQTYGLAPKEYVLHLCLRKARESLVFTRQSIAEVARNVGFSDPYYFSRLFHARIGLTPSLFRSQHGASSVREESANMHGVSANSTE